MKNETLALQNSGDITEQALVDVHGDKFGLYVDSDAVFQGLFCTPQDIEACTNGILRNTNDRQVYDHA